MDDVGTWRKGTCQQMKMRSRECTHSAPGDTTKEHESGDGIAVTGGRGGRLGQRGM